MKRTKPIPFWQARTLEELAAEQGVTEVEDLDEVAALWPAKDDPDALLAYLLSERAARRLDATKSN